MDDAVLARPLALDSPLQLTISLQGSERQNGVNEDDVADVDLPLPPPLDHATFLGEHFDATTFLLGRRHLGLDELRMEVSRVRIGCG